MEIKKPERTRKEIKIGNTSILNPHTPQQTGDINRSALGHGELREISIPDICRFYQIIAVTPSPACEG